MPYDYSAFDSFNPRIDSFNPRSKIEEYHVIYNSEAVLVNIGVWMDLYRLELNLIKNDFVVFEVDRCYPCLLWHQ
jgi:hypothetical protein